jgi:hypothetical protein
MSEPDPPLSVKGHCPDCGPERLGEVVGHHHTLEDDDNSPVWFQVDYRILRCRGCGKVYFQTDEVFSEDEEHRINPHTGEPESYLRHKIAHWPSPPKRERPHWSSDLYAVDSNLDSLFEEIYVALNNDLHVLSAIGIRTAFDRASELLSVDPAKTFNEKLSELVSIGKIGPSERGTLDILTDAGSAAAHRGWKPKPKELDTMMSIFEAFLYRNFVLDAEARVLQKQVPGRPERKKPSDDVANS